MAADSTNDRDELIARTRRWFEEVWNQRRAQTIDELMAPDAVMHGLDEAGGPLPGPEGFRRFQRQFLAALPDVRLRVEDVLCDGDRTAVRVSGTATHAGDGFGVPATGRPVRLTAIAIARWRGGRIVEGWNEFDAAGLLRQITGPAPAAVKTPPG